MIKIRSSQAASIALLALSAVWVFSTFGPLFYSLLFPTRDIQDIIRALEGRKTLDGELVPLVQQVTTSTGKLERAILVNAYWHMSGDYNVKRSQVVKITQLSYLAWFEKRSRSTILIVTRTARNDSELNFAITEGNPFDTLREGLPPVLLLTICVLWCWREYARSDSSQRTSSKSFHEKAG